MREQFAFRLVISLALGSGIALATPITTPDFGPGAVVEGFEGLTPGPNLTYWSFLGANYIWYAPGVTGPFTFGSGVRLTSPNTNAYSGDVLIGDYALGSAAGNWSLSGNGTAAAGQVPGGTAYFGFNGGSSLTAEFTFPAPVTRVGVWITTDSSVSNAATMYAFDTHGNLIDTATVGGVNATQWRNNFFGVENTTPIQRIVIAGNGGVMDNLTFEPVQMDDPVPEPSTVSYVVSGLLLCAAGTALRKR